MTCNMLLAELQTKLDKCQNATLAADHQWTTVSQQLSQRTLVLGRITMSVNLRVVDKCQIRNVLPESLCPQSSTDFRFLSHQPDTSLHCQTTDTGLVHRAVHVPPFAGTTRCIYPRRDGQAKLAWMAGYIPRWFTRLPTVTRPSTNRD